MAPRISVIIPVHNGERYLGEALKSVFEQTLPPDEVLVVDDGSTDRSAEIIGSFPNVRCLNRMHAGQAQALNAGIAATAGEFLAFLDADDRWLPKKLELQVSQLAARSDVDIVFGHTRQFVEPGLVSPGNSTTQSLPARLPSAMLLRRSAWARVGPFSEQWAVGSVIEWCARADDRKIRWIVLDDLVYERRIHGNNSSLVCPGATREYARALKHILEERRRGPLNTRPARASSEAEVARRE